MWVPEVACSRGCLQDARGWPPIVGVIRCGSGVGEHPGGSRRAPMCSRKCPCRQEAEGEWTQKGGLGETGRGGVQSRHPRGWRRQERDLPGASRAGGPQAEEGFGVAGDGGRGGKGRGARVAGQSLAWQPQASLGQMGTRGLGGKGSQGSTESGRPAGGPQGWPADCWQWHPLSLSPGSPGPRWAAPHARAVPPSRLGDRWGGAQLDTWLLAYISHFLISAAAGKVCKGADV